MPDSSSGADPFLEDAFAFVPGEIVASEDSPTSLSTSKRTWSMGQHSPSYGPETNEQVVATNVRLDSPPNSSDSARPIKWKPSVSSPSPGSQPVLNTNYRKSLVLLTKPLLGDANIGTNRILFKNSKLFKVQQQKRPIAEVFREFDFSSHV